jgi:Sulfotransferase family
LRGSLPRTTFDGRTKVLYVAGLGRSGSTLLGNVLGQMDGFVSVGEIRGIWEYGLLENRVCGCGAPFRECALWRSVFDEAFGGIDKVDPREMIRLRESWARTMHVPLMLAPPGKWFVERRLREYLGVLEKLYHAVQIVTGARVIVDTSKFPSYGSVLEMAPSMNLRVMHLVRDPRAVAYSWMRKKRLRPDLEGPKEYMPRRGAAVSSLRWLVRNITTEVLWRRSKERYLLLRYEDFAVDPQETIGRVLKLVREEEAPRRRAARHKVRLGMNHNIWGNPSRFRTGMVEIQPDTEWVSHIEPNDRRLVTLLTLALLVRYGYPLAAVEKGSASGGHSRG